MLVVRTIKDPAYPLGKLVCSKQSVWLYHLALAVYPLGLYGVKPRTPFWQKTAYDPHSGFAPALFDTAVVLAEPAPDLFGDVPRSVVPDENHDLLAGCFEPLGAPLKESGRYGTDGSAIHESQPSVADLWQVESVAGDGFRSFAGDRLWRPTAGSGAEACPPRPNCSKWAVPPCSTNTRPRNPPPRSRGGPRLLPSVGR
jgi:hypothetical protein